MARVASWRVALVLAGAVGAGLVSYRSWLPTPSEPPVRTRSTITPPKRSARAFAARAIDRGLDYLDGRVESDEPFVFYVLDFLERRFELGRWQALPKRLASLSADVGNTGSQRDVFRRLIDPDYRATLQELLEVDDVVSRVTTAALYCRNYPLGEDFERKLRRLAMGVRYHQTHAAMAIQWLRENDCGSTSEKIESYAVDLMAAGIRVGDELSDLEIERAAFLVYLEHRDRVPAGFAGDLLRLQNPDGGWSIDARGLSNWHPTFLAVWFLLEAEGRGNGAPMIVSNRD